MTRSVIGLALLISVSSCAQNTESSSTTPIVATTEMQSTTSTTVGAAVPEKSAPPDGKSSDQRSLTLLNTVSNDNLQPKSIVYSGNGLFFAQNMMYRHNVSIFDPDGNEVATISDMENLADFGVADFGIDRVTVRGSPVEAAFTSDGAYA